MHHNLNTALNSALPEEFRLGFIDDLSIPNKYTNVERSNTPLDRCNSTAHLLTIGVTEGIRLVCLPSCLSPSLFSVLCQQSNISLAFMYIYTAGSLNTCVQTRTPRHNGVVGGLTATSNKCKFYFLKIRGACLPSLRVFIPPGVIS